MHPHEDGDLADHGSGPDGGGGVPEQRGITPKHVVIGILVAIVAVFAIANSKRVEVNFLFFTTQARVVTVIVISAILGFVVGYFVGRPSRAERKRMEKRG